MENVSNIKLKPCPFCNGEANIGKVTYSDNCEEVKLNNRNIGYFGHCIQCPATMQQGLSYETEEIAIKKWNKRFVTKDKHGKDVFADNEVWFHWMGKKTKAKIVKDDLFIHLVSCKGEARGLPRTFCKSDRFHIELIEESQ